MLALKTTELTKVFKDGWRKRKKVALDHLSLELEPGKIVGYLGPNGAGKTTTFKLLLGLLNPTHGEAWIFGKSIDRISARNEIGFMPDQPYFYDYLTAAEFLDFSGQLFNLTKATRRKRIEALLELVDLADVAELRIRNFSRGMLQRIGVAQALINEPSLILLDEPMSGLDPVGRKRMRDLILRLKEEGKTVLYSTHILSDVEAIADGVAILSGGKLRGCGNLSELMDIRGKRIEMNIRGLNPEDKVIIKSLASKTLVDRGNELLIQLASDNEARQVSQIVTQRGAELVSLVPRLESLEDIYLELVNESAEAPDFGFRISDSVEKEAI